MQSPFSFYQTKRVFLACPGDLTTERSRFPRVLDRVNNLRAHTLGLHLEAVGWERVIPSFGRPQALINDELVLADLVIVMLWNRIGSPSSTDGTTTGTQEEFALACRLHERSERPLVWVYFRKQTAAGDPQSDAVAAFRHEIENGRQLFFREYAEPDEWEDMLAEHLVAYLDGLKRWNVERNRERFRLEHALLYGSFAGEGLISTSAPDGLVLLADLDGDGQEEQVFVSHDFHGPLLGVRKHGATYLLPFADVLARPFEDADPETVHGVFDSAKTIHVAIKDVNNDGFPEILLAASDGCIDLRVAVWGLADDAKKARHLGADCLSVIGEFEGQTRAYVHEGGTILLPYGTAGLAWRHRWNGTAFEADDIALT